MIDSWIKAKTPAGAGVLLIGERGNGVPHCAEQLVHVKGCYEIMLTVRERTPDGHHVVIGGRRWRATDPAIPEPQAAALRRWLMAARRDVRAATRSGDTDSESRARACVQAAKTALGERGPAWWEQTDRERTDRWQAGVRRARAEGFVEDP